MEDKKAYATVGKNAENRAKASKKAICLAVLLRCTYNKQAASPLS